MSCGHLLTLTMNSLSYSPNVLCLLLSISVNGTTNHSVAQKEIWVLTLTTLSVIPPHPTNLSPLPVTLPLKYSLSWGNREEHGTRLEHDWIQGVKESEWYEMRPGKQAGTHELMFVLLKHLSNRYSFLPPNFYHSSTSYHFSPLNYFNILGLPTSSLVYLSIHFLHCSYNVLFFPILKKNTLF